MISNDFRDFASEMSRGIAIDFGIDFGVDLGVDFALDFALESAPDLPHILPGKITKAPTPPNLAPKMASSNTLPAKIAAILTLRTVSAHKSSQSLPYAYLSRRLCFKIVEIPSLRGRSKFLHAQHILHARLLNFRRTKIFDMRHEKF